MKIPNNLLGWISVSFPVFIILISQTKSHATQTQSQPNIFDDPIPNPNPRPIDVKWKISQVRKFQFQGHNSVLVGVLCFIAASISSAAGVGGGGLYIPILTIVAGLDLKSASSLTAFLVTGGSIANVLYNLYAENSSKFGFGNGIGIGGKKSKTILIDYDIALLSVPCMLLGVSVGVICNLAFPEWVITILFAIFLGWSTFKTCGNGVRYWKKETQSQSQTRNYINEKLVVENNGGETSNSSLEEPLMVGTEDTEGKEERYPWKKLVVLIIIWFSFSAIYILRGDQFGQGIMRVEPCGVGYWILSLSQVPLSIAFTSWILCKKDAIACQGPNKQGINKPIFPIMALMAGCLAGVFGIGGGMFISPLLLQVGVTPEVTSATCAFMVFFSSTMSAFQYLLLGMEHIDTALIFSAVCFAASLVGLVVVQRFIKELGRASLIVFSLGIVMALSTILMTCFGALNVWQDYSSGKYMGFKLPC